MAVLGPAGRRRKKLLKGWNPTAPGPMPAGIRALFEQEAGRMVDAFIQPRQRAIGEYTNQLATDLGGLEGQLGGIYGQAQQGQASSDAALAQMLRGQGQGLADELAKALAAAGQDTGVAQGLATQGQGAAGASFAQGSAGMGQLLSEGAAQRTYAAKLPGIARLGGLQATRGLQAQGAEMGRDLSESMMQNELEKWIAAQGFSLDQAGLDFQKEQFGAEFGPGGKFGPPGPGEKAEKRAEAVKAREDAVARARKDAVKLARDLAAEMVESGGGSGLILGEATESPKWTRGQIVQQIRDYLRGELGRYGVQPGRINKLVRDILQTAGVSGSLSGTSPSGSYGGVTSGTGLR